MPWPLVRLVEACRIFNRYHCVVDIVSLLFCFPGLEPVCRTPWGFCSAWEAGVSTVLSQPAGHWRSETCPRRHRLPVSSTQSERLQLLCHSTGEDRLISCFNDVMMMGCMSKIPWRKIQPNIKLSVLLYFLPLDKMSFLCQPGDGNSYTVDVLQQPHGVSGSGEDQKGTSCHPHDGGHQHGSCADHHQSVQPGGGGVFCVRLFSVGASVRRTETPSSPTLQILQKVSLTDPSRNKTLHILAVIQEKSSLSQSSLPSRTHHLSPMYLSAAMLLVVLSWQYLSTTAAQAQGTGDMPGQWTLWTSASPGLIEWQSPTAPSGGLVPPLTRGIWDTSPDFVVSLCLSQDLGHVELRWSSHSSLVSFCHLSDLL